ncbi:MAG: hypothetical protein IJZ13_00425 [Clostridia bacterium]|nr:hypothetical protein [Clostridia bacterium]
MDVFIRRLLSVLFALVLCVYVGYQIYQSTYTSVQVTDAVSYTVYDTIDTTAFIVRDETVIPSASSGYIYYTLENGDRIAKGGQIAQVFPSESDALIQQKLNELDQQIAALETIQSQGGYNRTNLDLINAQLSSTLQALVLSTQQRDYSLLHDTQFELLQLFCKQQLTTGKLTDLKSKIDLLKTERKQLAAGYSAARSTISAPVAGYFISQTDGLETTMDYDTVEKVMPTDVETALAAGNTATLNSVGKVAGDYQWYLLCVLEQEQAAGIGVGKQMTVRLPFVSADSVPVTVAAVNKDREGRAAIVLKCIYMSEELAAIRRETMQIQLTAYSGLYVQDSALQFNADNETGVYVRVGNTCTFRKVEVLYHSESGKYSICAEGMGNGYLELYDDIIVKGKGLYDGKIIR